MKIEHIDRAVYLYVVKVKVGKRHTCIIPKPAMEALEAHLQGRESQYVFEGRNHGRIDQAGTKRLLDKVAERADLWRFG